MHRAFRKGVFTRYAGGKLYSIEKARQALSDVESYQADLALVGSDTITELPASTLENAITGQLECRMVFAVQRARRLYSDRGIVVATSYPVALRLFLAERGITEYKSVVRPGKLENAIARGLADAIFDIKETGASLQANDLCELAQDRPLTLRAAWRSEDNYES